MVNHIGMFEGKINYYFKDDSFSCIHGNYKKLCINCVNLLSENKGAIDKIIKVFGDLSK